MSLKTLTATAAVFISLTVTGGARGQDVLTGDKRLACEAILCLASGTRPDQCMPSLKRYFSISHRRWSDTVKARRNFLDLCPRTDSDPQMSALLQVQAEGAGRCDANALNAMAQINYETGVITVPNTIPSYCEAYVNHPYTYNVAPVYRGTPGEDGRWYSE